MKEEKMEQSAQKSAKIQKETGVALADEELVNAAGGERWWVWGNEPVNPVPGTGSEQSGKA